MGLDLMPFMFENWLFIAFVAPMLWSLVNLIDVYFVDGVYRDEYDGTIISGLFPLIFWILVPLGVVSFHFPGKESILFFLSGNLFLLANFFYFKSLFSKNDAALVQIFWNLTVPFTLFFSWIFIGEKLQMAQYFGIMAVLAGVVFLCFREKRGEWKVDRVLPNMVPAALFLSFSLILSEQGYRFSNTSFFSGYLVFACGMAFGTLVLGSVGKTRLWTRLTRITALAKRFFFVFFIAELLALVGTLSSQRAIDLSPSASFVATIEALSPVFVMLFSLVIVVTYRLFFQRFLFGNRSLYADQLNDLFGKAVAIIMVAVGIYFVS